MNDDDEVDRILLEELRAGPKRPIELIRKIKDAGMPSGCRSYAKERLGISTYRAGEHWYWELPNPATRQ